MVDQVSWIRWWCEKMDESNEKGRAKKLSDLLLRARSAVVYVSVSALCIFLGKWTTMVMIAVTAGICASEFYYMLRADAKLPNELLGIIASVLYPVCFYYLGANGAIALTLLFMLVLIAWYVFFMRARIADVGVSFFGAAYCGLLLCGIVEVRSVVPGFWGGVLVFGIFASIWLNDAAAYLVGSKIGKHKLAPRISPKKSWEGFIAGLMASMLIWVVISFLPCVSMSIPEGCLFGLLCGLAGVLGDLAESRIKRNAGVKDSGTIMPGHGGLLDRTDSLFFVSVTAALCLLGFGCIPVA